MAGEEHCHGSFRGEGDLSPRFYPKKLIITNIMHIAKFITNFVIFVRINYFI